MTPRTWVVDASFTGSLLLPDENSEFALELVAQARTKAVDLVTSDLWWHEMANLLVSAVRRKRIVAAQLSSAWALCEALPIRTLRDERSHRWPLVTTLAVELGLSAYEASYLTLAESLKAGLASEDKDLRKAAALRRVPVWSPSK